MLLWFVIAGVTTIVLAHTAPFPFLLERFAPSQSVWRVPRGHGPPTVYLTFDDGPNPAATPQLLDALRDVEAVATFFLIDAHLDTETAPIVRRMFEEGHGVALHSDTRKLMFATPAGLAATLTRNADRIEQLAGRRPCRLFRPHAGWRSGSMYEGLRSIDYKLVGWGWGLWDFNWYRAREAKSVAGRLARRVSAGDIVVMHDGHHVEARADRRYAIEATRLLVPAAKARGLTFGNLCSAVADSVETAEAGPDRARGYASNVLSSPRPADILSNRSATRAASMGESLWERESPCGGSSHPLRASFTWMAIRDCCCSVPVPR